MKAYYFHEFFSEKVVDLFLTKYSDLLAHIGYNNLAVKYK